MRSTFGLNGAFSVISNWRSRFVSCRSLHNARKEPFNVLFFGRDTFSCRTLEVLHSAPDVCGSLTVVTSPDQQIGKKHRTILSTAPIKATADSLAIPTTYIPRDAADFETWTPPAPFSEPHDNNVLVTASFGHAIPSRTLELFSPSKRLNVHPSLLPKFRGAAPIQRTILQGLKESGVSILEMQDISHGFDTGPVWAQRHVNIPPDSTYHTLEPILAEEGASLLVEVLRKMRDGTCGEPQLQDSTQASIAFTIKPGTARVNWETWDAPRVERTHRAIAHQRLLTTLLPSGASVQLHQISIFHHGSSRTPRLHPGDAMFDPTSMTVIICCADKTYISVQCLQTELRKALDAKEWWNGIRGEWKKNGVLKLGSIDIVGKA